MRRLVPGFSRLTPLLRAFPVLLLIPAHASVALWEQTNRKTWFFEAEKVVSGALFTNRESPVAWNVWTTDAKGNWSGGVVIQSPKILADRESPEDGAPPLEVTLPGIPPGRYDVRFKMGRNLGYSRDGKEWVSLATKGNVIRGFGHSGGDLKFFIDDRFGNPGSSGWSYLDALTVEGIPASGDLPRRPFSTAATKDLVPGESFNESFTYADPVSGRQVRRLSSTRDWNHLPTYHNGGTFGSDGKSLVFTSWPEDRHVSWLLKAEVESGRITVLDALDDPTNQGRYNGNNTAMNPAGRAAFAFTYTDLWSVPLDRTEKKLLLHTGRGGPTLGHPAASLDGKTCYAAIRSNAKGAENGYAILAIDVATGASRAIFGEATWDCIHVQPNPVDPDLLLVVRDLLPLGKSPDDFTKIHRMFVLNLKTGAATALRPGDPSTGFLTHAVWNFDGTALYYETGLPGDRHEVGRLDLAGKPTWRHVFAKKGLAVHVGAHTKKDWMVLESENLFAAPRDFRFVKFDEPLEEGMPPLEVICLHDSDLANHGTRQEAHGHPVVSPDGRFMSFGSMRNGRSDPHVVKL